MHTKRIIPCLDIRDGRVVKGVQFLNIRDAGDPVEAAVRYNEAGADELVLLDINASHEGRGTMLDVVSRVAEQVFIPFTVGGGISSMEQIRDIRRAGSNANQLLKIAESTHLLDAPQMRKVMAQVYLAEKAVVDAYVMND